MKQFKQDLYLFQSRVLTHLLFWLAYFVFFGLLGTRSSPLFESFELQFVSMPARIGAAYFTIYLLMPKLLMKQRYLRFGLCYLPFIIGIAAAQRLTCFYFHECFFQEDEALIVPGLYLNSLLDLNGTVLLVSCIKLFKHWLAERHNKDSLREIPLELKADKRYHRVLPSNISYIEGMGNYVTFYLSNHKSLITYMSLKEAQQLLPSSFKRIHKSFIINQDHIDSYNHENVEITGRIIPIGKSYEL